MTKTFVDHIIVREEFIAILDEYSLPEEEKAELLDLIDGILHHHALDVIFTHLPREHHPEFVELVKTQAHNPALLDYVKAKVSLDIESEIKSAVDLAKRDIIAEIKKSHARK